SFTVPAHLRNHPARYTGSILDLHYAYRPANRRIVNGRVSLTATWLLADMTWAETAQLMSNRPIGLLPIGAIEAHGPHLPLDTDVIIAEATSLRAAQRLHDRGFPAIVLPPLSYSVSFVGTSFPGTTPVDA